MTTGGEVTTHKPEQGDYGLHIRPGRGMQSALKQAAELAYEMGDTQKPDLVNLFNLYLAVRRSIQLIG